MVYRVRFGDKAKDTDIVRADGWEVNADKWLVFYRLNSAGGRTKVAFYSPGMRVAVVGEADDA